MSSALLTLCGWALLGAPAQASDAGALSSWTTSAVEAVPFLEGEVGLRMAQHVGLQADLEHGGEFATNVAFRLPASGDGASRFDVYQLVLDRRASWGGLRLGRQMRLDTRGWLPFDGLSADLPGRPAIQPTLWAGRLWSPEPGEDDSATWVGGLNLHLRPVNREGEASRALAMDAGWMGRHGTDGLSHSLAAGVSYRRPSGTNASADAEIRVGGGAPGSRAGLRATAFLGRHVSVAPELRWEDLSPDSTVSGLRTPMDWLGGEGYAAASLATRVQTGPVSLTLSGGPVQHQDRSGLGGLGRGGLGWQGDRARAGAFGSAAAIAGSWVAGGGLEGGLDLDRLHVRAEGGLYRFQPLDGVDATIGEGRLALRTPLIPASEEGALDLSLDTAAGADRLLRPWARAELLLEGRFGQGGRL